MIKLEKINKSIYNVMKEQEKRKALIQKLIQMKTKQAKEINTYKKLVLQFGSIADTKEIIISNLKGNQIKFSKISHLIKNHKIDNIDHEMARKILKNTPFSITNSSQLENLISMLFSKSNNSFDDLAKSLTVKIFKKKFLSFIGFYKIEKNKSEWLIKLKEVKKIFTQKDSVQSIGGQKSQSNGNEIRVHLNDFLNDLLSNMDVKSLQSRLKSYSSYDNETKIIEYERFADFLTDSNIPLIQNLSTLEMIIEGLDPQKDGKIKYNIIEDYLRNISDNINISKISNKMISNMLKLSKYLTNKKTDLQSFFKEHLETKQIKEENGIKTIICIKMLSGIKFLNTKLGLEFDAMALEEMQKNFAEYKLENGLIELDIFNKCMKILSKNRKASQYNNILKNGDSDIESLVEESIVTEKISIPEKVEKFEKLTFQDKDKDKVKDRDKGKKNEDKNEDRNEVKYESQIGSKKKTSQKGYLEEIEVKKLETKNTKEEKFENLTFKNVNDSSQTSNQKKESYKPSDLKNSLNKNITNIDNGLMLNSKLNAQDDIAKIEISNNSIIKSAFSMQKENLNDQKISSEISKIEKNEKNEKNEMENRKSEKVSSHELNASKNIKEEKKATNSETENKLIPEEKNVKNEKGRDGIIKEKQNEKIIKPPEIENVKENIIENIVQNELIRKEKDSDKNKDINIKNKEESSELKIEKNNIKERKLLDSEEISLEKNNKDQANKKKGTNIAGSSKLLENSRDKKSNLSEKVSDKKSQSEEIEGFDLLDFFSQSIKLSLNKKNNTNAFLIHESKTLINLFFNQNCFDKILIEVQQNKSFSEEEITQICEFISEIDNEKIGIVNPILDLQNDFENNNEYKLIESYLFKAHIEYIRRLKNDNLQTFRAIYYSFFENKIINLKTSDIVSMVEQLYGPDSTFSEEDAMTILYFFNEFKDINPKDTLLGFYLFSLIFERFDFSCSLLIQTLISVFMLDDGEKPPEISEFLKQFSDQYSSIDEILQSEIFNSEGISIFGICCAPYALDINLNLYQLEDETIKLTPITVDDNSSDSINLLLLDSNLYIVYQKGIKLFIEDENKFKHLILPIKTKSDNPHLKEQSKDYPENKENNFKSNRSDQSETNNIKEDAISDQNKPFNHENQRKEIKKEKNEDYEDEQFENVNNENHFEERTIIIEFRNEEIEIGLTDESLKVFDIKEFISSDKKIQIEDLQVKYMNKILEDETKITSLDLINDEHIKVIVVNSQKSKDKFPTKQEGKNNLVEKSNQYSQHKMEKDSDGSDLSYNEKEFDDENDENKKNDHNSEENISDHSSRKNAEVDISKEKNDSQRIAKKENISKILNDEIEDGEMEDKEEYDI